MKKTGLSRRALAMLLVIVMTLQLIPVNVFAFGELLARDTKIKVETINEEDFINWPIKIYDYVNDGMLFEWHDTPMSGNFADGHTDVDSQTAPYGGGEAAPITVLGEDFTYAGSSSWDAEDTTSPYYWRYTHNMGNALDLTAVEAVDYQDPYYMAITDGSGGGHNTLLAYFDELQSTSKNARYVVLAYRSKNIENNYFTLSITSASWDDGNFNRGYDTLPDSEEWTYKVFDLNKMVGDKENLRFLWLTTMPTNGWYGDAVDEYRGMRDDAYIHLTHIGFFDNYMEAVNYGEACEAFDKNPGEYLRHDASFTATTTVVTPLQRMDYIFSLYYQYQGYLTGPVLDETDGVYYGMDLTTTSKANGDYTNAYATNTYWTWKNGGTQTYKYTENNVISSYSFQLDPIGVQQKTESNGAMYVRLTADNPSRVLLSKFREDKAAQHETWIPLTSDVNYAVLVYRPNGLTEQDQYAFWAQGYDASSANDTNTDASNWKYAAMAENGADWESSAGVNPLSFGTQSGWQYVVVPLTETIGAKDSDMSQITRLARAGIYLPELSGGKSLDLAYACYFSTEEAANKFGMDAVSYMTSPPSVTTSATEVSWGSDRVWESGNNINFGMGYSTGGSHWTGYGQGEIYAGGSNTTDAYGYDAWMLGYATMHSANSYYNTYRKDPITGQSYTAQYTASDSNLTQQNVNGTSNYIYRINGVDSDDGIDNGGYDTSVLDFDGYELLETILTGNATAGLLEGSLRTVNVDGTDYRVPVYRQETVEFIAYNLYHALRVPRRDANGDYTMAYVAGKATTKFGGVDLNGDGQIGYIDLDGDPRNGAETNEESVDLATALRHCLGISLSIGSGVGVGGEMGSYEDTLSKDELLIGSFEDCRYSIKTAMDAAYYLLNSLFVANSYNQKQDDYYYLQMPSATIEMDGRSGTAYVFDAGFTTGVSAGDGEVFQDDGSNESALLYSPVVDANGNAGTGTIYLQNVTGKTYFNYSKTGTSWTTRFPFLPITDAEGDFAGGTYSYYFWEESRLYTTAGNGYYTRYEEATDYVTDRRNYNYVIASNGEFVYNKADELFFEFEGDDDVYLFINGELVLDIGGAHAATNVYIDVNDYVDKARTVMAELAKYGYTNEMSIEEFDAMISGDTLEEYTYDSVTGKITGTKTVDNPYTAEQIEGFKRWCRLDLVDGQICQFDFYYMERHGWGANMRIFTNMHITDPDLDVDKTAYQYGQEIEYGGVIDPTASLEYNFALTNSGSTKLYNLTFEDKVIGVTLDPTKGLSIADGLNGIYVLDSNGGTLEAKDLTATVKGYNAKGEYTEVSVTFPEVNGDGGQTALKNFLRMLDAEGTEQDYDAEVTHAGSGLWVDATVIIHNIHYMLQSHQIEAGAVNNTVYLTATTRTDPNQVGSRTLYSDADHLIYTSGFPIHYQWAGHNIFMNMDTVVKSAKKEATIDDSQLNLYLQFFNKISSVDDIYYHICDKYGRVGGTYPYHTKFTDQSGNAGYLVNYDEPGIYTFYMLLYLKESETQKYEASGINASDIKEGEYAILRSQVYVADVEDSIYVLDYGLSTESLDVNGELFKNDYLFGPYGTLRAKLMGVSGAQPSYIDPETASTTDYSRISFNAQSLTNKNTIQTHDGIFKVNLAIPDDGKLIGYDSATGEYTLTGVGTVAVNATVPSDNNWKTPYLYYWYDDGVSGPAWPGTAMTSLGGGQYKIDIPADVTNVIINNGSGALQTSDLKITPGLESTIHVSVNAEGQVTASIETILEHVTLHTKVPADWDKVYVYYWDDNGENAPFPGQEVSMVDDSYYVDANGYYTIDIPGNVTNIIISDGVNKQSGDQKIYAGKEVWLEVSDTVSGTANNADGTTTYYYDTVIKYTLSEGYVLHASVPNSWKDKVYLYYWHDGMTDDEMKWPGIELKKGDFGWYTLDGLIPAEITKVIINDDADGIMGDGDHQTANLTVAPGLETWVTVNNEIGADGKYTATVANGSESSTTGLTFTPQKFMDQVNEMWMALTVHATSANPSALNDPIDIHNEVQMYKKISVVPGSVVYYEDTFQDISYNDQDSASENVFIHHGNGSGRLSQSVDQVQPYGQDAAYQDSSNELYSGDSLLAVKIMDTANVATFTFKGTGFEMISRTNAIDSASVVARVYKSENYSKDAYDNYVKELQAYYADPTGKTEPVNPTEKILPVISQFDHGNDGGKEAINQVPTVRITGLEYGEYTVELYGMPTYIFDPNNNYAITGTKDTYLYIDGLRIFQPMGSTHDAYSDAENGAQVVEIRELIMNGQIAVGALEDGLLKLSTGTITWTENLTGNGFDPANSETYESIKVDSTDDYLIKGPNNEVYMEGNASSSSLIFYVSEDAAARTHELQIAVRALEYGKFYGTDSNDTAGTPEAQLQYGILRSDGTYAWKNLTKVVSSTEQYYSIPYTECPVDNYGRYQIVLRAVDPEDGDAALVSYTSVKLNGLNIEKVEGVGEATILYYLNGVLIRPDYYLVGNINGTEYTDTSDVQTMYQFKDGKLTLTLDEATTVAIRRELNGQTLLYTGKSDLSGAASAEMYSDGENYYLSVPAGQITLMLKQTGHGSLTLTYCQHNWNGGTVTKEANCTETGIMTYTCTVCGHTKQESIPANGKHTYSGSICIRCGAEEPHYYLVGYINGSDHSGEDYLFVDSQLVVTFDATSYVAVKDAAGTWFMTDGWLESAPTTVTLYDCNTIETDNKLMVPGGVELTFTLEVNEDGTLTLSYKLPCSHVWDEGRITTAPSCTTTGQRIHTCSQCHQTKTESVPATGHNYVNGVCVNTDCGKIECRTIYFKNTAGWEKVYLWGWKNGGGNYTGGVWPGVEMSLVEGETDLYYYELPAQADTVIFNNNDGIQTTDLDIPTDDKTKYTFGLNVWTAPDEEPEVPELQKVYLQPGFDWAQSDAWFAAWFINGNVGTWVTMSDSDGDGCHECEIPVGYTGVVFVRMNPTAAAPSWNDGEKWNQTVDLTVEADRLFVVENPWNEAYEWKATGSWTDYDASEPECQHSYTEKITNAATCTTAGLKTYLCSSCGDSYTEEIEATGHTYADGACTGCGEAEPTEEVNLYLVPGADWMQSDAWFAAYFFGNGETFVKMTDDDGDGIYQCVRPDGYPSVIFCRMSNEKTDLSWDSKWNQTADLTLPTDGGSMFTVTGPWDGDGQGATGTWSTYVATASYSLRSVRSMVKAAGNEVMLPATYLIGDENNAMNLPSISDQLASDVVIGEADDFVEDEEDAYINIDSVAPVLSDDIRMNFYVTVPENAENVYMTFAFNGKEIKTAESHVDANGRRYYIFKGISPQTMGDAFDATLYATVNGVRYTDVVADYSMVKYCTGRLERSTDPVLVTLISDLLVYGAKTQIYQGYKTDALVTQGLELTPSTFPGLDDSFDKLTQQGQASKDVAFTAVTLKLSGKMTLRLAVKTDNPSAYTFRVRVAGVERVYTADDLEHAGDGKYYLYFDELKASCFDETIVASIERDGQIVGRVLTYSVNTYVQRAYDTSEGAMRELLEAIYNYGNSASALANRQG